MTRRRRRQRRLRVGRLVQLGLVLGVGILAAHYVAAGGAAPRGAPPSVVARTYSRPPTVTAPSRSVSSAGRLPASAMIRVPAQSQYPQLPNGCEVTSLSMLLNAVGHPVSKLVLAREEPTDPTPLVLNVYHRPDGQVLHVVKSWGNPNRGFVGKVNVKNYGYGIYHGPLTELLSRIMPGRAADLTGQPFSAVLAQVARGVPVVAWTTLDFRPTSDWVTWQSPEGPVHATPLEHAVLVVGYDHDHIFVNNPANGRQAQAVDRGAFIRSWKQLGSQAITVRAAG
ncbi:MAG: C39 family peptidase [Thermaerobacter sp.]|nr:C39 family peptidase [Thermaerobacter sp.]